MLPSRLWLPAWACLLCGSLPLPGQIIDPTTTDPLSKAVREVTEELERTIVTATKDSERLFELPYAANVADQQDLRRLRVVQDALRERPQVQMQRTSYGQTSPFLRGFTGYHTVMLIDGIRLNNSTLRSGPNEYWGLVDGLSLDRIETVFGPGSVLYGSDAVGGVVNAIPTRRHEFRTESSWDRRLMLRFSSAERSLVGRTEISGNLGESFGFVVGGSGGLFSDLDVGGSTGRLPETSYHQIFGDGRFDFILDEHWTLALLAQVGFLENVNRVHQTIDAVPFSGSTVGSDASRDHDWERDLLGVFLDGTDLGGFVDEIHVRFSWHRIEEDVDRRRTDGRQSLSGFDVDTFGLAIELASDSPLGRWTYGVDFYHDEVDSFQTDFSAAGVPTQRIQGPVGDDAAYDLLGVFVQDQISFGDDVDLIVGGRFVYAAADIGRYQDPTSGDPASLDEDWASAVGSARLLWRLDQAVHVYAGASQAFRTPNLSDLTRFDIARSGEFEIAAPDLDPERFLSFEVGTKVQVDGFSAAISYHYTIIDDLIVRQPTGAMMGTDVVVSKRNAGSGHHQGIELEARYDIDANWRVFGSFRWYDGQVDGFPTSDPVSRTEVISRLAPLSGSIGFGWRTDDQDFDVRTWVVLTDRQDRLSSADARDTSRIPPGGTPGFFVWNVEATYRIDDDVTVFASVENLLDQNYRIHGSGVNEPGVNAILGVDVRF